MIESVRIDDEGPDGTYLVIVDDQPQRHRQRITDDALRELDAALQPFRDHWAEGEAVRAEYRRHRGAGYCTGWVGNEGPCQLPHGHDGEHATDVFSRKV